MKILVVDDHQLFLDGFEMLLSRLSDDAKVIACANAMEAEECLKDNPDTNLIVLDLEMPGIDGLSLMRKFQQQLALTPIVFVSANENLSLIKQVMDAGAFGFIPKQSDSHVLLEGLKRVIDGEIYLPVEVTEKLVSFGKGSLDEDPVKYYKLSPRQLDVLRLMASGKSNKVIASELGIAEPTVKSHISVLFQAMDVTNRMECVKMAETVGLI